MCVCVHACKGAEGFVVGIRIATKLEANMWCSLIPTYRPSRILGLTRFYKRDLKWQAFLCVGLSWPTLASFFIEVVL